VILDPAAYPAWLAPGALPAVRLAALRAVPPVGDWQALAVDPRVGSVAHDDPGCLAPAAAPAPAPPRQGRLF
jgi:hypothetical protein